MRRSYSLQEGTVTHAHDRCVRGRRNVRRPARVGPGSGHRTDEDRAGAGHPDVPEEHGGLRSRTATVQPVERRRRLHLRSRYVRVQVLTNAGALDRDKQLAVVERLSGIIAEAAADPSLIDRTWVLLTEAPDGGWGLAGHANTNEELVAAARAQIAELQAQKPGE